MELIIFSFHSVSDVVLSSNGEVDVSVGPVHYSVMSFQGLEKVLNITYTLFTKVCPFCMCTL